MSTVTINLTDDLLTNQGFAVVNEDVDTWDTHTFGKNLATAFGVDVEGMDNTEPLDSGDTQQEATKKVFMNVGDAILKEIITNMKITGSVQIDHDNSGVVTYTLSELDIHYGESS